MHARECERRKNRGAPEVAEAFNNERSECDHRCWHTTRGDAHPKSSLRQNNCQCETLQSHDVDAGVWGLGCGVNTEPCFCPSRQRTKCVGEGEKQRGVNIGFARRPQRGSLNSGARWATHVIEGSTLARPAPSGGAELAPRKEVGCTYHAHRRQPRRRCPYIRRPALRRPWRFGLLGAPST